MTREAFFRFSIDDRLEGDTASKGDRFSLDGEFGSRPCQNILGEARILEPSKGEDADGEDSCFEKLFYLLLGMLIASDRDRRTLGKLGEFRLRAIGLSSDSGRLWTNDMFLVGDEVLLLPPFCTRSGGTCVKASDSPVLSQSRI